MQAWIDHFKELDNAGVIDTSNLLHIDCIRFCYISLLRQEILNIAILWNTHHIRYNPHSACPSGRPDFIYNFPDAYGCHNHICHFDVNNLNILADLLAYNVSDVDADNSELFNLLLDEGNRQIPTSMEEASYTLAYMLDRIDYYNTQI